MRRLRGHHLVCLHFYRGEGYSAAFVENLESVLAEVARDGAVVAEAADDVCAACPSLDDDGRCIHEPDADDEIRRLDSLALRLYGLGTGEIVDWKALRLRLGEVLPEWRASACDGCDWSEACREAIDGLSGSVAPGRGTGSEGEV